MPNGQHKGRGVCVCMRVADVQLVESQRPNVSSVDYIYCAVTLWALYLCSIYVLFMFFLWGKCNLFMMRRRLFRRENCNFGKEK